VGGTVQKRPPVLAQHATQRDQRGLRAAEGVARAQAEEGVEGPDPRRPGAGLTVLELHTGGKPALEGVAPAALQRRGVEVDSLARGAGHPLEGAQQQLRPAAAEVADARPVGQPELLDQAVAARGRQRAVEGQAGQGVVAGLRPRGGQRRHPVVP